MVATEMKGALRAAADKVSTYLGDVSELRVETKTVTAGTNEDPILAASTVIKLDGDNTSVIPATKNDADKWEVDTVLYGIHIQNVQAAIEYRSRMMESMLSLLRSGGGQ